MKFADYKKEYGALTRLGVPITIAQVGMTLQGLADTLMVGHHSTEELSAAGFVNAIFVLGILMTIGYSQSAVSQIGAYFTQGRTRDIVRVLKASMVADTAQCLLITGVLTAFWFCLPYIGQPAELLPLMQRYYLILLPSLPVLAAASAFRPFSDSINDTRTSMWILLAGNVWNVLFNWVLIYGHWGFPELGLDGAAWATASSRLFLLALYAFVFFGTRRYAQYRALWREVKLDWREMRLLNRLGWPIAVQMGMEIASFSLVTVFLGWGGRGWDGVSALAAHQVILQLSQFVFMFYVGIGSAVAIRVANYHGLGDTPGVRRAADAGYHMIVLLGIVMSVACFLMRWEFTGFFIEADGSELFLRVQREVALLAWPLVLYQFGDGMQTCYVNALRGYGDVKVLMKYCFIAYLVISLPLSYVFAITLDGGAFGAWMGFPFGLTAAAVLYYRRFRRITTR